MQDYNMVIIIFVLTVFQQNKYIIMLEYGSSKTKAATKEKLNKWHYFIL
jgi:hypothetical protein